MKILVDTHILLWSAAEPRRLSVRAKSLLEDRGTSPVFSAASLWEVSIKTALGREDFKVEPAALRKGLVDNGWSELPILSAHVLALSALPDLHKDPFDRILVAQSHHEGMPLITSDKVLAQYGGSVELV